MRILIDDKRDFLPDGSAPDLIVRNFATGMFVLDYLITDDDELYVDHDLGEENEDHTGYRLLSILEDGVHNGTTYLPEKVECVSDNGAGRLRIQLVIDKLYRGRDNGSKDEVKTEDEAEIKEAKEVRSRFEETT